jgi:signal peptidase I
MVRLLNWQLIRVRGTSMLPSLAPGTWLIVDRLGRRSQPPRRFDLVRFVDPVRPAAWAIKRLVGLPGEEIHLSPEGLQVDGGLVPEPHAEGTTISTTYCWTVGPDQCIVLGDNRDGSTDSRRYGPLPLALLTGIVRRRLWRGAHHELQGGGPAVG